jgi:hypothetical protein
VIFFGNSFIANGIEIKQGVPTLLQYSWCPYKQEKFETDMHTRRTLCEDKGRGQSDICTSHGTPKISRKPSDAGGEAMEQILPHNTQKEPCQ